METKIYNSYIYLLDLLESITQESASVETTNKIKAKLKLFITNFKNRVYPEVPNERIDELLHLTHLYQDNEHLSALKSFDEELQNMPQISAALVQKLITCAKQAYSSLDLQEPDLIFLLTAPFDEAAKTGDGQYAKSLVKGFRLHAKNTQCVWLREADGHYTSKLKSGLVPIPAQTIPTLYVLQPVANGQIVVSGYKCPHDELLSVAEEKIKTEITLRTPKIVLDKNNHLKCVGYQSEQGIELLTQDDVIRRSTILASQLDKKLKEHALMNKSRFDLNTKYTQLDEQIRTLLKASEADERLIEHINQLIKEIKKDFPILKIVPIDSSYQQEERGKQLLRTTSLIKSLLSAIESNIKNTNQELKALEIKLHLFENLETQFGSSNVNQAELFQYVKQLAKVESSNARELNTPREFNKALQIAMQDEDRKAVVSSLLSTIKSMSKNRKGGIDIHVRPPDTGILIMPEDILSIKRLGISVNVTVHEYKQNYTRRFLQQMTHELLRHADSVLFFNEKDLHNAIKAARSGQVDSKHHGEWPIASYELGTKAELTVAAQILSGTPQHPLQVLKKRPNILSFGTIRPGKGFEEALEIAQLLNTPLYPSPQSAEQEIANKITVIVAGDPQNRELMEQLFAERYGTENLKEFQAQYPYTCQESQNGEKRTYWKKAKILLELMGKPLNNPHLELYPWCKSEELAALKMQCKYVCRMDDMGMRNNGSAIISVLDVGIVYSKWGCVTDRYYTDPASTDEEGESYTAAVDLGEKKYGLHTGKTTWDKKAKIQSDFKRRSHARDSKEILLSIIKREMDQEDKDEVKQLDSPRSRNHYTIFTAQRLLLTKFALKKSVRALKSIFLVEHPEQPASELVEQTQSQEIRKTKTNRYARIHEAGNKVRQAFFWAQNQQDDALLSLTASVGIQVATQPAPDLTISLSTSC
ncbi:MAG: hypothetical protein P4L79_02165 [Legionella sp.]|uniref:hypothetical protein n=1 Tax=Legionella sp. TaxID=459 RepID=UPI002851D8EB|nr:hypothetical protein [Legionella sp.]